MKFRIVAAVSALASLVLAGLVAASPANAFSTSSCTITDTVAAATLDGTAGADVICILNGNVVTVNALGGNDTVYVGAGHTVIAYLGEGDDTFLGAASAYVTVYGEAGRDVIIGTSGVDALSGGADNDWITGGAGVDSITGDTGINYCDSTVGETDNGTCLFDTFGPSVSGASISPTSVDVGANFATTTFTFSLTDDAGPATATVACAPTSGFNTGSKVIDKTIEFSIDGAVVSPATGASATRSGTVTTVSVTSRIEYGQFPNSYVCGVTTTDLIGNTRTVNNLATLTVARSGVIWDSVGPTPSVASMSPSNINVGVTAQNVAISMNLSDNSGVTQFTYVCANANGNKAIDYAATFDYTGAVVTSSTVTTSSLSNNTLSLSTTVSVAYWTEPGTYNCSYTAKDFLNNTTTRTNASVLTIERIPPNQPTAPSSVTWYQGLPSAGQLVWLAPSSLGTPTLTDYTIQLSTNGGSTWTTYTDAVSTATSVNITGLSVSTDYWIRVRGENGGGFGSWSVPIKITTPAPIVATKPLSVVIDQQSPSSLRASWSAPSYNGEGAITDYVIQYSADNGANWTTFAHAPSTARTATFTGLRGLTTYSVRVAAVNSAGTGPYSDIVTGTTTSALASAPLNMFVYTATATTMMLAWDAPTDTGNVALTNYSVEYSVNNGVNWTVIDRSPSLNRSLLVSNLSKGTPYKFRVRAINASGAGPYSNVASGTTLTTAPSAPTGISLVTATATSLRVSWNVPADLGGTTLSAYEIQYSSDNGSSWKNVDAGTPVGPAFTVTGLLGGTTYLVRVNASNSAGTGLNSAALSATTLTGPPSAPLNLKTTTAGTDTITIGWDLPLDRGGLTITNYIVEMSSDGGVNWSTITRDVSVTRSQSVSGLSKGRSYRFRIAAVNSAGTSATSAVHTVSTLTTTPSAPTGLEVTATGNSTVTLRWNAPTDNGGRAITDYAIELSTNGGSSWSLYPHTPFTSTTFTLTGLTGETRYVVRVAAVNEVGTSSWSFAIPAKTTSSVPSAPLSVVVSAITLDTATIMWSEPIDNGGLPIIDYFIEYSSDNGVTWTDYQHDILPDNVITIDGLLANKKYKFRVSAVNILGPSDGTIVTGSTGNQVPNSVTGVTATGVAQKKFTLNWKAPSGTVAATDYRIEISSDGGKTFRAVTRTPSTSTKQLISGLTKKTRYKVRIKAIAGESLSAAWKTIDVTTT